MDVLQLLERYGIPLVLLLVLGAGIWRVLTWVAANVVTPIVAAHVKFLEGVQGEIHKMAQASNQNTTVLEEQTPILGDISAACVATKNQVAEHLRRQQEDRAKLSDIHAAIKGGACKFEPGKG